MRRTLALVVLALILTPYAALVDAQFIRGMRRNSATIDVAPTIIIDTPTFEPGHALAAGTLRVEGTVIDDRGIVSVTWACATCTVTSGEAVVNGNRFVIDAGAAPSSVVIGQDSFSVAANTNLTAYTGTAVKGASPAWTERVDTVTGGIVASVRNAEQAVSPNATGGNGYALYTMQLAAALSGTHYYVQVRNANTGLPGSDDPQGIVFGRNPADENNRCQLLFFSETNTPDLSLYKRVAGTDSAIGASVDANFGANDVGRLEVNGSSIKVSIQDNGSGDFVEVLSRTDAFCDDNTGAHSTGIFFGDILGGTGDPHSSMRLDDFIVTDLGASGVGLAFDVGGHTLTVTATDTGSNTANDTLAITRGASDTEDPLLSILTDAQTVASATFAGFNGTASDNVGVTSVACTSPTTTPGTLVISGTQPTWSAASFTLASGGNTITCVATDAAMNTRTVEVILTYQAPGETTPPAVDITSNGGATINNGTATTYGNLAGTASDASGVASITWSNNQGGSGSASFGAGASVTWTIPTIALAVGNNLITVLATDTLGNQNTDTITITRTSNTLTITTPSPLPPAIEDVQYPTVRLNVTGGTAPYTFTNNGAGNTLNDGDPHCAGLSIEADGDIVGTPTAEGTCTWSALVTDNVMATDDENYTLVVQAPGSSTAHSFFDAMCVHAKFYKCESLRNNTRIGELAQGGTSHAHATYNFAGDTDPQKQDAMKVRLPLFLMDNPGAHQFNATLTAGIDDQPTTTTINTNNWSAGYINRQSNKTWEYLIDTNGNLAWDAGEEIVSLVAVVSQSPGIFTVSRGRYGTTPVAASAGAVMVRANIDLPSQSELLIPVDSEDGNTYLFIVDAYYTDTLRRGDISASGDYKEFQFTCCDEEKRIWLEPNLLINGPGSSTCTATTDVGFRSIRTYNQKDQIETDWTQTDGNQVHPNNLTDGRLDLTAANTCIKVNKWVRYFWRFEQRANDYDFVTAWIVREEDATPAKYVDNEGVSLRKSDGPFGTTDPRYDNQINVFWFELDTSTDGPIKCSPGGIVGSTCKEGVIYYRNWIVLKDTGLAADGAFSDANMSTFLVAPLR